MNKIGKILIAVGMLTAGASGTALAHGDHLTLLGNGGEHTWNRLNHSIHHRGKVAKNHGRRYHFSEYAATVRDIDRRITKQRQRIRHGISNGELTRREVRALRKRHARIANKAMKFAGDGRFTAQEERRIMDMLDRTSRKIRREKHDDNHRRHDHRA